MSISLKPFQTLPEPPVVRIQSGRLAHVLKRIFVGSPDLGFAGQTPNFLNGLKHRFRRTFEQVSDGPSKYRVPGKQIPFPMIVREIISNVGPRMAGHIQHSSCNARKHNRIPFLKEMSLPGDAPAVARASINGDTGIRFRQLQIPARVIPMMMCVENCGEAPAGTGQKFKNRLGVPGIDRHKTVPCIIRQQEYVIVGKCRTYDYLHIQFTPTIIMGAAKCNFQLQSSG